MEDEIAEIHKLAKVFRQGIEDCPKQHLPIQMRNFPNGACGDAAYLLAKYFSDKGYYNFDAVMGGRGSGYHTWLERGNLIVDITADQFPDSHDKVIVLKTSPWHQSFEVEDRSPADYNKWGVAVAAEYNQAYLYIIQQIKTFVNGVRFFKTRGTFKVSAGPGNR